MNHSSYWKIAFIILLVINLIVFLFLYYNNYKEKSTRYSDLKTKYITLAKSQKHMLNILLENPELKKQIPEYDDLTTSKYQEAIRRKIVALQIEIENFENE